MPWMIGLAHAEHEIDLSYPPPGVEAPVINVDKGEHNTGVELSPAQARWREEHYGKTHRVIDSEFREFVPKPGDPPKPAATNGKAPDAATGDTEHQSRAPPGGATASAYHGRLWQISSPHHTPSFLFATAHLEDPRILRLPPAIERAFDESRSLTLELTLDKVSPDAIRDAMLFGDDRTLAAVAGAEVARKVAARLGERGMPAEVVRHLKPWAAAVLLSTPAPHTGMFLDRSLLARARKLNKPVFGLETPKEQFDALDRMPMQDQVAFLNESLEAQSDLPELIEEMVTLYLAGDLQGLAALSTQQTANDNHLARVVMDRLVYRRNQLMAQRMRQHIEDGAAFIAIGALHLPGPKGVIELLRAQGYEVTAVLE
jgi:uncharacterized protein YbaP (TraB family)